MTIRHLSKAFIGAAVLVAGFVPATAMAATTNHINATTKSKVVVPSARSQAPVIAWESRAQFAHDLLAHFGYAPDKSGYSSLSDVSNHNANWGWVHKALELGIVPPQSSHKYGTQISQTEAANAVAHLFKMSLGNLSATQWASERGLFAGSQAKVYLTQSDTKSFLARFDSVKNLIQQVPGSWTLSATDINTLSTALKNSQKATDMQMSEKATQTSSMTLTTQGKKDMQGADVPDTVVTQTTATKGAVNDKPAFLSSATTQDSQAAPSSTGVNGPSGVYVYGTQVYENDGSGSGWTQDSATDAASMIKMNEQQFLPLTAYQNVTVTKSGETTVYTAQVNPATLASLVGDISSSLTSGSSSAAEISSVFKHISATDVLTVSTVNGQLMVTSEQVHIAGIVPVSALPSGIRALMEGEVVSLSLNETVSDTYTYDQTAIDVPQGLPGYVASTGSSTGSTSSNTKGSTASASTGTSTTDTSGSTGAATTQSGN